MANEKNPQDVEQMLVIVEKILDGEILIALPETHSYIHEVSLELAHRISHNTLAQMMAGETDLGMLVEQQIVSLGCTMWQLGLHQGRRAGAEMVGDVMSDIHTLTRLPED